MSGLGELLKAFGDECYDILSKYFEDEDAEDFCSALVETLAVFRRVAGGGKP